MPVIDDILKEFTPASKQTWAELFLKETKQRSLSTNRSVLGFTYLPFYSSTDKYKKQTGLISSLIAKKGTGWNITSEFTTNNPVEQNKLILAALENGVSSIRLKGNITNLDHLSKLLKGVLANYIEINFLNEEPLLTARLYKEWCDVNKHDTSKVFGSILYDPISNALVNGKWKHSKEKDLELLYETAVFVCANFTKLKCVSVNSGTYHYSGANLNQTLAYSLSHGLEYLNYFKKKKTEINTIIDRFTFIWPVGINFFSEIAALRALYISWNSLIQFVTGENEKLFAITIHAETSLFYWSGSSKHNNLLRSTTQTMAAVSGGATSVFVYPYNELFNGKDLSANRLAANVQLLLREESFLDKVIDPSGGSFFVESLTDQLADNVIELLKDIESAGGFLAEIEKGNIQENIKANADTLIEAFKTNKIKIVGSNIFPDLKEGTKLTKADYFGEKTAEKIDLEPLHRFILDTN